MAKNSARLAVRQMPQQGRHAVRLAVGVGAAVLALGLQTTSPVLSSGQVSAQVPTTIAAESFAGTVAGASTVPEPDSSADPVLAPEEALGSYGPSVVLTGLEEGNLPLNAASARVGRPAAGTLIAPLEVLVRSSPYGLRASPITGSAGEFHWGLDFSAPCGTPVYSADGGVVREVGWHQGGGGNRVELDHGNGLITTYNHLEGTAVKKGEPVRPGQIIATVGTTGASTGCHLHFETILNGSHTDPEKWALIPLHQSETLAGITMADYGKAPTTTDAPAWAVPAPHRHDEAAEREDGSQGKPASAATTSSPASAPAAAPAPSPMPAPAPSTTRIPASTQAPAPAPSPSAVPVSKAVPTPVPAAASAPSAPVPTPAPAPSPAPSPSTAPDSVPAPLPARKLTQKPANEPVPVPTATGPVAVPPTSEPGRPVPNP